MTEKEKMVDVEVNIGKELGDELKAMTKAELINRLVVLILRNKVQDETVADLERKINRSKNEIKETERRLAKAEDYVEQARAMIESIMERWYHYHDENN